LFRTVKRNFIKTLAKKMTRKKNRILFGSWGGEIYGDNPKYLLKYLQAFENLELVWCGNKEIQSILPKANNIIFVEKGSWKAIYYCLTSKYIFVSQRIHDITSYYNAFKGAVVTHLWHGVPLKKIGLDEINVPYDLKSIKTEEKYDYFVSASQINSNIFISAFSNIGARTTNMISSGTPRNDFLINANDIIIEKIKLKYEQILGITSGKRLITYMPTFRRKTNDIFDFSQLNIDQKHQLEEVLQDNNAVLVDKNHFITYKRNNFKKSISDNLIFKLDESFQKRMDVQELLLMTDILISDYSGCFLDFALLDKPIIHFAYDYDYYKNVDSGLYFELEDVAAGPIAKNFDELIVFLKEAFSDQYKYTEKRKKVRSMYMEYEKGRACENIANTVIGLNKQDGKKSE
jgi:CDP-glycerol glycerophosphotransferase (TagB/SpsB family)